MPGMFGGQKPNPPLHGAGTLYLIDNGRVTEPPEALVLSLGRIAAETISVMMEQSMQTALTRSYFGTKVLGYSFKQAIFPPGPSKSSYSSALEALRCMGCRSLRGTGVPGLSFAATRCHSSPRCSGSSGKARPGPPRLARSAPCSLLLFSQKCLTLPSFGSHPVVI